MPSLSHSQCETWQQCPKRWQLTKIDRVPQAPSEALILGSAIHAALEADAVSMLNGNAPYRLHELRDRFIADMVARIHLDDPTGQLPIDADVIMYAKGAAMLRAYVEHIQPHYAPESCEESFAVAIPHTDRWQFTGRIDARIVGDDGVMAVLDWKTAGKPWEAMKAHQAPQATAYLWQERESGRVDAAHTVRFVVFPAVTDGQGGYTCEPQILETSRTPRELDSYPAMLCGVIAEIAAAKKSGEFAAKTGPLCGWCGVLGACRDGQNWLRAHNRKPAVPVIGGAS